MRIGEILCAFIVIIVLVVTDIAEIILNKKSPATYDYD